MLRIGILASTSGTDITAIIDAIKSKKINVKICTIISDKKDSLALEKARKNNIDSRFIDSLGKDRQAYDKEVAKELGRHEVKLVLLIGYMRILSSWFLGKYKNRIINIHPSLLPAFAGKMDKDVHKMVIDYGCKVSGCTLHFVNENVDLGPIIMQKAVDICPDETSDSLKRKVQRAEQDIIVMALDLFEKKNIKLQGRKVILDTNN